MQAYKKLKIEFDEPSGMVVRVAMALERQGLAISELKIHPGAGNFRMELAVRGDLSKLELAKKQLLKLINVIRVEPAEQEESRNGQYVKKYFPSDMKANQVKPPEVEDKSARC